MFNKFCKIIERHFVEFKPFMDDVKLFVIDEVKKEKYDNHRVRIDNIFLPFQKCAFDFSFDGKDCLTLIGDVTYHNNGVFKNMFLLMVMDYVMVYAIGEFDLHDVKSEKDSKKMAIRFEVKSMTFYDKEHEGIFFLDGYKEINNFFSEYGKSEYNNKESLKDIMNFYNDQFSLTCCIIEEINSPENFIVSETTIEKNNPKKNKKKKKKKKILRKHQRPNYIILRPNKARKKMNLKSYDDSSSIGSKTRGLPNGGDVRAHDRFLSDKKYRRDPITGEKLEQKIIPYGPRKGGFYYRKIRIPAFWRGPSESRVGNKYYKVLLDK